MFCAFSRLRKEILKIIARILDVMTNTAGGDADLLTPVLHDVRRVRRWRLADWDLAIRQARQAGLLSRLAADIGNAGLMTAVAERARPALEAALILAEKHAEDVARELRYIGAALAGTGSPVILLKGASYAAAGLPPARGRLFGDIDVLVARNALPAAEAALLAQGWESAKDDEYDQSYYRRWMHEIPPLQHKARRTTIDLHHTITPPTSAHPVDARRMIEAATPVGDGFFRVLAPVDMVLHSAVHLFDDGEFANALRDLDDLNRLLRHFGAMAGFWDALARRAASLGLERPLYYALRYAAKRLGTPVPAPLLVSPLLRPPAPVIRRFMDLIFAHALAPPHASCRRRGSGAALGFLYLRAHHLRMPLRLLLPHLLRKAVMRRLKPATV